MEEAFSSIKAYLIRQHHDILQIASVDPIPIIHAAFQHNIITKQHCNGWISHSGYNLLANTLNFMSKKFTIEFLDVII